MLSPISKRWLAPRWPRPLAEGGRGGRIQGTWETQITLTDCAGHVIRTFQGMLTFHQGGTLIDGTTTPPALRAPAEGVWRHTTDMFHPRQIPASLEMHLTSVPSALPARRVNSGLALPLFLRSGYVLRVVVLAVTVQRWPDAKKKLKRVAEIVTVVAVERSGAVVDGELGAEADVETCAM
jgi:hypothetical protein